MGGVLDDSASLSYGVTRDQMTISQLRAELAAVRDALAAVLDTDGCRGTFSAVRLDDARKRAEAVLRQGEKPTKKCQCPIENHNDVLPDGALCPVCGGMQ
jgi:ElaB/YqjD/DUF883 family membrane-anchored ribosome-binding protein